MSKFIKKYFKPSSLTWWSGITMLVEATASSVIEKRVAVEKFVAAFGLIGIRGALD